MTYITLHDIGSRVDQDKLIQLTDDDGIEVKSDVVDAIIADAEGTVESFLRTRYTLPVPVTAKVRSLCLDIAVFKLVERRAVSKEGIFEVKEKAHDKAIKFLQSVQKGEAALDVPATEETRSNPKSSDEVLRGASRESAFSDEKMRGF
jgi:phage gp36-like protein